MRITTQPRLQLLLLSTSVISTMLVMQRLWNQTDCDRLCKVMKANQYVERSSNLSADNASLYCETAAGSTDRPTLSIHSSDSASSSLVPFCPFDKNQPKMIVILTYQRCGSTFFGNLFNQNPEAFYMFEPLDSLYSSLYGTKHGWNVPSDIVNYRNGTARTLPPIELQKVFEFLETLFSCRVGSLPTETLVHPYIHDYFSKEFSVNRNYVQCVRKLRRRIQQCMQYVPWTHCGGRFGETSEQRLTECRQLLSNDTYRAQQRHYPKTFDEYLACMARLRTTVDQKCAAMLTATCRNRQLRVIKLVRATMDSMEPLLRTLPNFRVVHLMRDPRAVVLSRQLFDSSARGLYSEGGNNRTMMTREAILYCRTVVRDVLARRRLERQFPGKIYSLVYDDLVKDLKGVAEKVYSFIDAKIPQSWIRQYTSVAMMQNATRRANRWQQVLSRETNDDIVAVCSEFFRLIPNDWPLT